MDNFVSNVTVSASLANILSSSTVDALEVVINRDDTDLQLERITPEEYLLIPTKTQKAVLINILYVEDVITQCYLYGLCLITLQIY